MKDFLSKFRPRVFAVSNYASLVGRQFPNLQLTVIPAHVDEDNAGILLCNKGLEIKLLVRLVEKIQNVKVETLDRLK
jgi:hypothetical protein